MMDGSEDLLIQGHGGLRSSRVDLEDRVGVRVRVRVRVRVGARFFFQALKTAVDAWLNTTKPTLEIDACGCQKRLRDRMDDNTKC